MPNHEPFRITETGCYEWTGSRTGSGDRYGRIKINGRILRAHRFVWSCAHGPIPERMEVMHICDNPACIRLDHLRLGTHAENMADMAAKGRAQDNSKHVYKHGDAHHNTKLKDAQVAEIRVEFGRGRYTQKELAQQYGVSQGLVSKIVRGENR